MKISKRYTGLSQLRDAYDKQVRDKTCKKFWNYVQHMKKKYVSIKNELDSMLI